MDLYQYKNLTSTSTTDAVTVRDFAQLLPAAPVMHDVRGHNNLNGHNQQ
jgi:hypothetical protein